MTTTPWTVPARCGPWVLERELARGGQGAVYVGRRGAGPPAAVKLLLAADPRATRRFRQEAQVLARLEHPHLPRVIDLGEADGRPFLAMELIEGETLQARVERLGPLPWATAVAPLVQVARALEHCHQRGVVHRDVKPGNVVLEASSGRAVLVDFGLLRRDPRRLGELSQDQLSALSLSGELKGTPQYMPPEQARGEEVGPAADVYALGATLCYALSGAPPFTAPGLLSLITQLLQAPPPDLAERVPGLPPGLAQLCRRALAKDPADRPRSALAFAEALERELPAARATQGGGSSRRWWVGALLAGGPLALLAGWSLTRPTPPLASPVPAPAPLASPREALGPQLVRRAHERLAAQDLDGAQALLAQALALDPDDVDALLCRALLGGRRGAEEDVRRDLERVLELDPDHADAHFLRSQRLFRDGELGSALASLDRAIALRPAEATWITDRAGFRLEAGDLRGCEEDCARALALDPGLAGAWFNRGRCRQEQGRLDEAEADFTRAQDLDPQGRARALRARAVVRAERGEPQAALEDLTAAVRQDPTYGLAWHDRAQVLLELGRREEALADLRQALQYDRGARWGESARGLLQALQEPTPGGGR